MQKFLICLLAMLSISCKSSTQHSVQETQLPKTDPIFFCMQFQNCLKEKGKEMSDDGKQKCISVAAQQDHLRDAYVFDCQSVTSCEFVTCMYLHTAALEMAQSTKED